MGGRKAQGYRQLIGVRHPDPYKAIRPNLKIKKVKKKRRRKTTTTPVIKIPKDIGEELAVMCRHNPVTCFGGKRIIENELSVYGFLSALARVVIDTTHRLIGSIEAPLDQTMV